MRFLSDMGVSMSVVEWLRNNGHDAVHLREQQLQRLSDEAIFQKAHAEQRVVLTFDLDFGEILANCAGQIVSVVLFRLHNPRNDQVIQRLEFVLGQSASDLEAGAIVVVEAGRHRVRRLPIGH